MKRIVSLLIMISMLASCCLFLGSCDRAKEKHFEKDATAALSTAFSNALSNFFTDDADIGKTVSKALEAGMMEFSFDNDDLGDVKVDGAVYFNEEAKAYAITANAKVDGEKIAAELFLNSEGITVSSKDILGSSKAFLISPSSLADGLEDSYLGEILGVSDASAPATMVGVITKMLDFFAEQYELAFSDDEVAKHALINELFACLEPELRTEKIEINGEKTKCVIATYTIDNSTVAALVEYLFTVLPIEIYGDMSVDEFQDSLIEEINSAVEIDATLEFAVAKRSNSLAKVALEGSLKADGEEYSVNLTTTFSDTEIAMNLEIDGDESFEAEAIFTKEESRDAVEYTLEVNAGYELISLVYTIEESGDFTIEADIYGGDEIKLEGSVESEKKVATINFDSIKLDGHKYDIGLSLTFHREAEFPEIPSAKDIVDMTEDDWEKLEDDMEENGVFGGF